MTRNILSQIEKTDKSPATRFSRGQVQDWAHNREVVQEAVKYGSQFGIGLVGKMVHPSQGAGDLFKASRETQSEAGTMALKMFEGSAARKDDRTWGQAFGGQYRAWLDLMGATMGEK